MGRESRCCICVGGCFEAGEMKGSIARVYFPYDYYLEWFNKIQAAKRRLEGWK